MNVNGHDFVACCFADITGYQKILSWTTSGEATHTPFLYCGFAPKFFLLWNTNNGGRQGIVDIYNAPYNPNGKVVYPHSSNAVATTGDYGCDLLSNGIKVRASATSNINHTYGNTYVALAIGQSLVGSNNVPANGR